MPGARWDGLSGALNFCVAFLCFFTVLEQRPSSAIRAEDLAFDPVLASDPCAQINTLPDHVIPFLDFAQDCAGDELADIQVLDGDVLVMFHRLNDVRVEHGLSPLTWHAGAANVARLHAVDMLRRNYFSHESPEGMRNDDRMRLLGRTEIFGYSGENLAYYRDGWPAGYDATTLQAQLERSPSHLEGMINPDYTHGGAAIVRRGDTYIAVQVFLSAEGELEYPWPSRLFPGLTLKLPEQLHGREVGGWRLQRETGEILARAYNNRVIVPEFDEEGVVRLVVLVAENPHHYMLFNGPVSDLSAYAP